MATSPGVAMNSGEHTETLTFLFTDIEGSSALWHEQPDAMRQASARHDAILRSTVKRHHGDVVKMTGDGMHAAFHDPRDAITAVVELQRTLGAAGSTGGIALRVRCGLHAGAVQPRDGDFFGSAVNRAARVAHVAHGGQILVSQATALLARDDLPDGVSLRDVGAVRLRGLPTPERLFQVLHADLREDFPALRSLEANPNNLPEQATSFIGRETEIAQLKDLLGRTRLLTLTGSGGVGKTRLSIQVAAELLESYPDGVWLVELASMSDPALVPQTVAVVLGLKEQPHKTLTQTLVEHLKSRQLLLVLDNAEHLLTACAQLADAVMRESPQVVLLVSSREGLGIAGEVNYRVPSLSTPDPNVSSSVEALKQYAAVQLFIDRALAVKSLFQVDNANAPAVASICHHLDGIPLAIELAAARVRSMSVEEVNQRLDQRFRLLTGGSRTALPRQQTLRALIDWSYDLLSATEQALFRRLSVFAGGCTLEAVEAVCAGEGVDESTVLDLLTSLCDKNLVTAEDRNGATRYRFLETVRQYARERLRESVAEALWQGRHLAYFLALAEEAEPQLTGADQQTWLERLEAEHDNLRSALARSSATAGDAAGGLRLAGALFQFWFVRGYWGEGRGWLSGLLAADHGVDTAAARAKAINGAGVMAWRLSDYPAARALHQQSLAIRRELGDRQGIALSLNNLGNVASSQADCPAARALYEESLVIRRELGDQQGIAGSLNNLGIVANFQGDFRSARALHEEALAINRELGNPRGIATALNNLGETASDEGDYVSARALYDESLAVFRELGDRWGIARSLNNLGNIARHQGGYQSAQARYKESLAIRREMGDRWGIADSLEGLAYVALAAVQLGRAASMLGGAERLRQEIDAPQPPADRLHYDRQVAAVRAAIGDDTAFDLAWQEGSAMTLEQAIEYALATPDT